MPRLLTSFLVLLLGAWPARPSRRDHWPRKRRGALRPSRPGTPEEQDPVEAADRARARSLGVHQWPGEAIFSAGDRCTIVPGRWRLTLDAAQRAHVIGAAGTLSLDPENAEVWETQLESLLTLQVPGARMQVVRGNAQGWQMLEVRAPTSPQTVLQLDRAAVARVLGADNGDVRVELRVMI